VGRKHAVAKSVGVCAVIVAMISLVVVYVAGPLNADVWHLTHGNFVECGVFKVAVPRGWYAESIDEGCQLIRTRYTFRLQRELQHPEKVFLNLTDAQSVQDKQWQKDVVARLRREGKNFLGTNESVVAGIPTLCFEWNSVESPFESVIACNVDKRMVVTFFCQDQKWKSDFNEILHGIQIRSGS
jgi:hypothetical protein